jgi:hypothetical protein
VIDRSAPSSDKALALRQFLIATSERRTELPGSRWQTEPQAPNSNSDQQPFPAESPPQAIAFAEFDVTANGDIVDQVDVLRLPPPAKPSIVDADNASIAPLSAGERLATLIHYAIAPLSFSPASPLTQHRAHASGGGKFAVAADLVVNRNGAESRLRWLPLHQGFEARSSATPNTPAPDPDHIRLVLVAQHGLVAKSYGSFGFLLTCFECGMIGAQWALLAHRLGYRGIRGRVAPHYEMVAVPWTDTPLLDIEMRAPSGTHGLDEARLENAFLLRPKNTPYRPEILPYLSELLAAWQVSDPLITDGNAQATPADFPLATAALRRSSGVASEYVRLIHGLSVDDAESWLQRADNLCDATLFNAAQLAISVLIKTTGDGPILAYMWQPGAYKLEPTELTGGALTEALSWFSDESTMIVTIGSDVQSAVDTGNVPEFANILMRVGAWAHCLALVAAEHGAAARALKGVPDAQSGLLLPVSMRSLLQIYVGFEDLPNPLFPI